LLPEKIKDVISEKEFINIEEKVKKYKLSQFKSLYKDELLIKDNLPGSKIIFTKKYPSINTREFRLENGIRVFLKPTKNEEKSFTFEAISMGGYSHANLIDLQSAKILDDVILESSLGNFSRAELNNKINPSFVDAEVWVDPFQEGLSGGAITKYTKELFELIYLNFTSVNFNEVLLENIKSRLREEIRNENLDPNRVFYKKLIHAFYQNHPRRKPQTLEDIDQIKLDKIKDFYKERFADSSDFIFTFVGDFSIDEMKPYIEKYLGSLPNINRNENFIDHNVRKENKSQYIEVRENSEEKSINYRIYTHEIKNNIKNRTALYILKNALDRILYEEIRENRNLVYSIQADILRIDHFPTQSYSFVIVFQSDPKNNSLVFIEIDRILEKFRNNDFEESYIEEAKLHRINELKEAMQSNSFIANAMTTYLYENQPITTINNLYDAVKSITSYEINKFSKKTFTENFIQATLLPKN
jgi:zinc protease